MNDYQYLAKLLRDEREARRALYDAVVGYTGSCQCPHCRAVHRIVTVLHPIADEDTSSTPPKATGTFDERPAFHDARAFLAEARRVGKGTQ